MCYRRLLWHLDCLRQASCEVAKRNLQTTDNIPLCDWGHSEQWDMRGHTYQLIFLLFWISSFYLNFQWYVKTLECISTRKWASQRLATPTYHISISIILFDKFCFQDQKSIPCSNMYDWPPDTAHIRTLQPQHYLRLQIWGSICISDRHSLHQIFFGLEKIESSAVIVDWQGSRSDNDKRQSALCLVQSSPLSSECVMRREVGRLVRRERGLYTQSGSLNTLVTQGSNLENSDN